MLFVYSDWDDDDLISSQPPVSLCQTWYQICFPNIIDLIKRSAILQSAIPPTLTSWFSSNDFAHVIIFMCASSTFKFPILLVNEVLPLYLYPVRCGYGIWYIFSCLVPFTLLHMSNKNKITG